MIVLNTIITVDKENNTNSYCCIEMYANLKIHIELQFDDVYGMERENDRMHCNLEKKRK